MKNNFRMIHVNITTIVSQLKTIQISIGKDSIIESFPNEIPSPVRDLQLPDRVPMIIRSDINVVAKKTIHTRDGEDPRISPTLKIIILNRIRRIRGRNGTDFIHNGLRKILAN